MCIRDRLRWSASRSRSTLCSVRRRIGARFRAACLYVMATSLVMSHWRTVETRFLRRVIADDQSEAGPEGAWRCPRIVGGVGKSYARLGYGVCQPRTLVPGGRPRHGGPEEPSRTCMTVSYTH